MDTPAPTLDELRRRLDAIDDRLHDLVMERADVVVHVAALKQTSGQPTLRPGREAEIVRRLAARHRGPFPLQSLVRLWRELLGGTVAIQGRFTVAVAGGEDDDGPWDLARDHFGGHLPLLACAGAADVFDAVADGRAQVGVLPMPTGADTAPWWTMLAARHGPGPRIVARLPFAGRGNGRPNGDAVVIAVAEADPTGDERSLLAVAAPKTVATARLVAALERVGASVMHIAAHRHSAAETWHLVELDGTVAADDQRLAAALKTLDEPAARIWPLGTYARPLPREKIDDK